MQVLEYVTFYKYSVNIHYDHFPKVKLLEFYSYSPFRKSMISHCLRLNTQLTALVLIGRNGEPFFGEDSLRNLIEFMKNLKEFTIS